MKRMQDFSRPSEDDLSLSARRVHRVGSGVKKLIEAAMKEYDDLPLDERFILSIGATYFAMELLREEHPSGIGREAVAERYISFPMQAVRDIVDGNAD